MPVMSMPSPRCITMSYGTAFFFCILLVCAVMGAEAHRRAWLQGYENTRLRRHHHYHSHSPLDVMADIMATAIYHRPSSAAQNDPIGKHSEYPEELDKSIIQGASPRFEIRELEERWELMVEVPGVTPDDLVVELHEEDRMLHIHGSRGAHFTSGPQVFDQRFDLAKDTMMEQLEVSLSHGILKVVAPKRGPTVTRLDVVQTDKSDLDVKVAARKMKNDEKQEDSIGGDDWVEDL